MLLLAGDLTQVGQVDEAEVLVGELAEATVPVIAVLGNHDLHSDRGDELAGVLEEAGVIVLEGGTAEVAVGDARWRGRCGRLRWRLPGCTASAFGEPEMKAFVRRTVESASRLEHALSSLDTDVRVALMHYSPVADTLGREPLEIYPFLGSYLLAEAVDRAGADLVLHGHAHRGTEQGMTPGGVRVRNVAQPVLGAPFRLFELDEVPRQLRVGAAAVADEPAHEGHGAGGMRKG